MHADTPALDAGTNVVNRIVVAMRFDSDDELGYPGIDLDGRGCPMLGLVGERGGRYGEGHRGRRGGCHANNKSAYTAAFGVIVGNRARTVLSMLVNRCTADIVRVLAVFCGMIVVLMPGGHVLGDDDRRS